jgi:hypothetical protein
MNEALEKLLEHPRIWRAGGARGPAPGVLPGVPTGYAALDRHLPAGGWPRQALTEILVEGYGRGELRLLMPALAALSRGGDGEEGWIAWIAPPLQPYPPALAQWGMDVSRVLVVRPRERADVLWAAEQALASGSCAAVLLWPEETGGGVRREPARPGRRRARASTFPSRRLQLAAEKGGSLGFAFRPARVRSEVSAAALRLALARGAQGTDVVLLKNRGGRPVRIPNVLDAHAG